MSRARSAALMRRRNGPHLLQEDVLRAPGDREWRRRSCRSPTWKVFVAIALTVRRSAIAEIELSPTRLGGADWRVKLDPDRAGSAERPGELLRTLPGSHASAGPATSLWTPVPWSPQDNAPEQREGCGDDQARATGLLARWHASLGQRPASPTPAFPTSGGIAELRCKQLLDIRQALYNMSII
jgi:hypothetical protein